MHTNMTSHINIKIHTNVTIHTKLFRVDGYFSGLALLDKAIERTRNQQARLSTLMRRLCLTSGFPFMV